MHRSQTAPSRRLIAFLLLAAPGLGTAGAPAGYRELALKPVPLPRWEPDDDLPGRALEGALRAVGAALRERPRRDLLDLREPDPSRETAQSAG